MKLCCMNTETITAAAQILATAKYAIALTGAGLSVESGIPSFRGPDGLWTKYGQPSNLSYRVFSRDPQDWWEKRLSDEVTPGNPTYDLKEAVDNAEPNPGHLAIAELESAGIIRAVITQNVDDLHGRAGSRNLLEIHGNRNYLRCIGCGWRRPRAERVITDVPPLCAECGGDHQAGHGDVRRAHPAGDAGCVLRGDPAMRRNAVGRHVGNGEPGRATSIAGPGAGSKNNRGQSRADTANCRPCGGKRAGRGDAAGDSTLVTPTDK